MNDPQGIAIDLEALLLSFEGLGQGLENLKSMTDAANSSLGQTVSQFSDLGASISQSLQNSLNGLVSGAMSQMGEGDPLEELISNKENLLAQFGGVFSEIESGQQALFSETGALFQNSVGAPVMDFFAGAVKGAGNLDDVWKNVVKQMEQMVVQFMASAAVKALLKLLLGGLSGGGGFLGSILSGFMSAPGIGGIGGSLPATNMVNQNSVGVAVYLDSSEIRSVIQREDRFTERRSL